VGLVLAILAGSLFSLGAMIVIVALSGEKMPSLSLPTARLNVDRLRLRLALSGLAGGAMFLLARWPVAVILWLGIGFFAPTLAGASRRRRDAIARTEAVAAWAEQLRDTISASSGLQEAISVTSRVAPIEIRPAVVALATGMRRHSLPVELVRFANVLEDPVADQVVVALSLASQHRGQNLTRLLDEVASAARSDASMRTRVDTTRAQSYSDARAVTAVVIGMFVFMLLAARTYLEAFDSFAGQSVLAMVSMAWGFGLWLLVRLAEVERPPRILKVEASQ